jgi:hypothetical protein
MGLVLSSVQTITFDRGSISRVLILPDLHRIEVDLIFGYVDQATGQFVAARGRSVEITGEAFDSLAQRLTTGKSFYEEIKTAIWEKLIEMGVVSGMVE